VRLESLFNFSMVKTLITILFRDMNEAYRKFHSNGEEEDEFEEDITNNQFRSENEYLELLQQVASSKISTREHIKNFIGNLLALCSIKMKYNIIEYVSRCIIFDNKNMRKSLFNEILIQHKFERATRQLSLVYFENP
jgi:hypothetical protein